MHPLRTSLEPGTEVNLAPTIPPVTDSAIAKVKSLCLSISKTTDSIVSSSVPKTNSPIISLTAFSSSDNAFSASCSDPALTVIRTLRPSIPLAWNAIVAPPTSSKYAMRSVSISSRPDSVCPQVFSTRLFIMAVSPALFFISGKIHSLTIIFISNGTPGTA